MFGFYTKKEVEELVESRSHYIRAYMQLDMEYTKTIRENNKLRKSILELESKPPKTIIKYVKR